MMRRGGRALLRLRAWALAALLGCGAASAATVQIVDAGTLELRQVDGQELVLIGSDEFSPSGLVEVSLGGETLRAERIEFNRTARTLTLVGGARYHASDGQSLRGDDLVIDLETDMLTGQDVFVSQGNLTILGDALERVPGQLQAQGSYFSPCGGCGQTPNDYAFSAEQLLLYPGDRLVAYGVQVLLADHPVLFLPALVLPLNDESRQPRLDIGRDEQSGYTALLDLPFVLGDHTLGTTRLRYFENRPAHFGAGVDLRSFAPLPFVDTADIEVLALPKEFRGNEPQEGYVSDIDIQVRGDVPLERAKQPLGYTFKLHKQDIGRRETSDLYGVATFDFRARANYPRFSSELTAYNLFGRNSDQRLSRVIKWPEVTLDPQKFYADIAGGELSADVEFTAGQYTAASNAYSPSAQRQGVNISTSRLEAQHDLDYARPLWEGAALRLSNDFTGRYYGTGARTVDLRATANLTQSFDFGRMQGRSSSFGISAGYVRYEGTSPFQFDRLAGRRLSAPLEAKLSLRLADGLSATARHSYDLLAEKEKQAATDFGVRLSRKPIDASLTWRQNFYTGALEDMSYAVNFGGSVGAPVREPTPEQPLTPAETALQWRQQRYGAFEHTTFGVAGGYTDRGGLKPLTLRASFGSRYRSNNWNVAASVDVEDPKLRDVSLKANFATTYDQVVNPVTFSTSHRYNFLDDRLSGNVVVVWRGEYQFTESHTFDLSPRKNTKSDGSVKFSVGNKQSGSATNWQLEYGGAFDLRRGFWTAPQLSAALTRTEPGQRFAANAALNTWGLDQPRTELSALGVSGTWTADHVSVGGDLRYTRTRRGTFPGDTATDTLRLSPLAAGVRFPEWHGSVLHLTGKLEQTWRWVDGELQGPGEISPVLALTLDRCCWSARAEADLLHDSFRLSVGLPGAGFQPLLDYGAGGFNVPLLEQP